jgi:hypothetical protein
MVQSRRRQRGGANESLGQGQVYETMNPMRMGRPLQMGGYREMTGAPLDYSGMLDESLRGSARVSGLDASYADAAAQKGGRRSRSRNTRSRSRNTRSRSRNSRKSRSRKSRSRKSRSRKSRSRNNRRRMQRGGYSPAEVTSPTLLLSSYEGTGANLPAQVFDQRATPYSPGADAALQRAMQGGSRRRNRRNNRSRQNSRSRQNRNRRQRGGFAPVDQRSMLLTDYSKAGLPEGFNDPLLKN